ncbi:50S ribosomal protein L24 [Candidatus Dojkabacteria bacterium]|uniref:Large ribosomal subunit protein uL24 n=1 Tax=Candidatus Dojkabacteria bacterium TaxID=2099670 RepID=A0A955KWT5_9BACT|nr:50S ribosomal protein L24 [Candidatus Dojkabacteria bacterium]
MKIKKDDKVKVLYGKDAGKVGKVLRVIRSKKVVIVEGVNLFKKHSKGNGSDRAPEILTISKPLPASKVQVIDPESQKPTRVGWKLEGKTKIRVGKKTGKALDSLSSKAEPKSNLGKKEKVDAKTNKKPRQKSKKQNSK